MPVGERITFDEGLEGEIVGRGEFGERTVRFHGDADLYAAFERIGHVPLPPYIKRADSPADRERYQTVFARESGSVAAPTAGLHFTPEVLARCRERRRRNRRSSRCTSVSAPSSRCTRKRSKQATLHTRALPHHAGKRRRDRCRAARRGGGHHQRPHPGNRRAHRSNCEGETDIFLYPGVPFLRTGAMLTNFHLPRTSLLLLVCAFAGTDLMLAAYRHAVEAAYRFYSYGDCMLMV